MLMDKERRADKRRDANLNIRFTIASRSDDRTACIENISGGGMLLNSNTALQPGEVIHIHSAVGTPTDALLAWGKACAAKVVFCHIRRKQDKTCYGIGVRHHTPKDTHDMTEHKRSYEALEKSEKKFRSLVESSFDWIWEVNENGEYTYTSPQVESILGYTPDEIIGKRPFDFMVPEEATRISKIFYDYTKSGMPIILLNNINLHKEGHRIVLETSGAPIIDEAGNVSGYRGVDRDITKRMQAQEDLLESERRYRRQGKVLDAINRVFREALICESEKDVADTCLCVAEKLSGSKFGFIGEKNPENRFNTLSISNPGWDACKIPDSEAVRLIQDMEIRGIHLSTIREGKSRIVNDPASHSDRVGTPEGHPPVSSFLGVPLKRAGETIGMIGLANKESGYELADQKAIEDLSVAFVEALMRKRVEKGLQQSEERFRTVADFTYDWEDWMGPDGKYLYVSPSFERITGYSRDELLKDHRFLETLIHPDDQKKVERHLLDHVSTHGVASLDFRIINRNGETRWISHLCQAVHSRAGKWLGRRASNRDITEQKKIEAQLRQAQKMESISTLAGGIAHEFNNALTAVVGNLELLQMNLPDHENVKKIGHVTQRSIYRLSNLTNLLIGFARQGKYQPESVNLSEFVKSLIPMLIHDIDPAISLETDLSSNIPTIQFDIAQLQMLMSAILKNASEATKGQGHIRITTRNEEIDASVAANHPGLKPGGYVVLTVEDHGKGMDEKTKSRIFDPFFTTNFQGRGLGMAAVYGITKNHGGYIYIESEPGQGTVVRILLPPVETEIEEAKADKAEINRGDATILVIEDEEALLNMIRSMLEMKGCRVLGAKTGEEALDMAQAFSGDIDLAFFDMNLPDMDGAKLYPMIKEVRPNLKVIVCTGYSLNGPAREILNAGAQGFIQKPFSLNTLTTKVKEVLEGQ